MVDFFATCTISSVGMTIARPSRLRNPPAVVMALWFACSASRIRMTETMKWADGWAFKVVDGRRVWVEGGQRQPGMNWKRLLLEGPGEVPGRDEAIVRARARSAEKRVARGRKRR